MRKRNLIVMTLVGAMALAVTGCSNHTDTKKETNTTTLASERTDEPTETEENNIIESESPKPTSENKPPVSETETTTEKEVETDEQENTTEIQKTTQEPTEKEEPEPTEIQTEQPTTKPVETEAPKQEEPTKPEKVTTEEVTTEQPNIEQPTVEKADADDCEAIADKVIEYINSYRDTPATKLPGLTKYAQYRSRQLVSNFAHDTFDERAAATALQYGTYIDPVLYGGEGEPYYAAGAREAIAAGGYVGDIDYVAQKIALLVKGSQGHWCYVGSSEYPYIAVGITYESGMWYCDIAMAMENTDN